MFQILSTGSALPRHRKSNDDLSAFLDTSDEWISQRTGIRERAVCTDETLTQLLVTACSQALERAGVKPEELDLILCATIRGDYITPSQACVLQHELGAHCPAMDISAACTGFVYALDVAAGYFARKRVKKVLIAAGDTMTRLLNWQDRSTCVLFGDGAGAVVLGEGDALRSIHLTADGNAEVLEFSIKRPAEYLDIPLRSLSIRRDTLLAAIIRGNECIIPGGNDCVRMHDSVIAVTTRFGMQRFDDIFEE